MKLVIFLLTLELLTSLSRQSATWKTSEWQIKCILLRGHKLWKQIIAADWTIRVTQVASMVKTYSLMRQTGIKLLIKTVLPRLPLLPF